MIGSATALLERANNEHVLAELLGLSRDGNRHTDRKALRLMFKITYQDGHESMEEVIVMPWIFAQMLCLRRNDDVITYMPLEHIERWEEVQKK